MDEKQLWRWHRTRMRENTSIIPSKRQVSSEVGDEVAILQMESGIYYGLNAVGARVWQLIQQPSTVGDIQAAILREYDVDPERCARDVVDLLQKLKQAGLIDLRDEAAD